MAECNSPECKREFKTALDKMEENLYGEGPEGDKGVYGALKKKVGYKVMTLLLSAVLAVISFFAGFGINHESRISKTEVMIETNTKSLGIVCNDVERMKRQSTADVKSILDAISELKK